MLFAELHRKLGRHYSLAHDRAEDLLTSTVFQLLRYIPANLGLLAVLSRVRSVNPSGHVGSENPEWLDLSGITAANCEFWPRWSTFGSPDVVITLVNGATPVGRVVIEVKLDADKSGEADDCEPTNAPDPDQLR